MCPDWHPLEIEEIVVKPEDPNLPRLNKPNKNK